MPSPPKLAGAALIAAGAIDGPEDVILDAERQSLLRHARRTNRAVRRARLLARLSIFAKIGGRPLGPRPRPRGPHRRVRRRAWAWCA